MTAFDEVWSRAAGIGGWLTRDQGFALWRAACAVPPGGRILEIGSHRGRSTVVLASAARDRDAQVVAVDPFVARGIFGGPATRDNFIANIEAAGLGSTVRLITEKSGDLRPGWTETIDLLFVDGKHDYWTVRDDLRWAEYLPPGAPVFVHDAFASIGVTTGLLLCVLPGRALRYVGRTGSLARFETSPAATSDRMRMLAQLPWFARNVLVKLGVRLARLAGYRSMPDPY